MYTTVSELDSKAGAVDVFAALLSRQPAALPPWSTNGHAGLQMSAGVVVDMHATGTAGDGVDNALWHPVVVTPPSGSLAVASEWASSQSKSSQGCGSEVAFVSVSRFIASCKLR